LNTPNVAVHSASVNNAGAAATAQVLESPAPVRAQGVVVGHVQGDMRG
jgi:hypothetical protein